MIDLASVLNGSSLMLAVGCLVAYFFVRNLASIIFAFVCFIVFFGTLQINGNPVIDPFLISHTEFYQSIVNHHGSLFEAIWKQAS